MLRSPFSDVEIPDVPLTDFVLARAGQLGQKPALIDGSSGRTITYARLAESVRAGAAGLAERGFGKGDVFAHYAPNLPEYAVAFQAVASVGGVNTTANPLLTADELARQLRDCGARLLVTVPDRLDTRGRRLRRPTSRRSSSTAKPATRRRLPRCCRRPASRPRSQSIPPTISLRCRTPAAPRDCPRA
jgi:acyl-CoA synthetase (AMP-forming)/AMP-acid ligase II